MVSVKDLKPVKGLTCGDSENQVKLPSESPQGSWELNADKSFLGRVIDED